MFSDIFEFLVIVVISALAACVVMLAATIMFKLVESLI